MVDTNTTWLSSVLAKHSRDNSIVNVLSVETEPGSNVGDNYASIIVRAILKVVLGSGKVTTKRVILKKALSDLPQEIVLEMSGAFNLEGIVYDRILSSYKSLMNKYNVAYETFWPECLFTSHDLIMFEDLRTIGFALGQRKTGVDPQHANLAIKNLARLHSMSLIAISSGQVYPKTLPPYMMAEGNVPDKFFRVSLKSFANVIRDNWGPEWTKVEKKIRYYSENIIKVLHDLYFAPHKLSVICHGDCWVNNMMFKYDDQGAPVQLKFVDFQMCHYNSYGWDIAYFLHTSVHPKYIYSCYDEFIKTYCDEFTKNLERFSYDTSVAPTIQDVKDELTRLQPFGLATASGILPITMNASDVKISLDEMLNEESGKFTLLFEDQSFQEKIQDMFRQFSSLGMFDQN